MAETKVTAPPTVPTKRAEELTGDEANYKWRRLLQMASTVNERGIGLTELSLVEDVTRTEHLQTKSCRQEEEGDVAP